MEIKTAAVRSTVPLEEAFVLPPPGGPAIVAVVEERKGRTAVQQVLLASDSGAPGQDGFRVSIAARSGDRIPTPHNVRSDLRAALPGIAMVTSPYLTQNRYGAFGYAIGRSGRADLCLYGWQSIQSRSTLLAKQGRVDVRLRLCRTGATETQLLSVMYGYTINAFLAEGQWSPFDPEPLSEAVGQPGREIYPTGAMGSATVLPQTAAAPVAGAPRARRERTASAATSAAVVVAAPQGPTVPPPPVVEAPKVVVPPPPGL